jgi:uncharacterized metal-binding protein YceD (DUF177 family)
MKGDLMNTPPRISPEFSRVLSADSIGSLAQRREIVAEVSERAALARRFGLISLERLTATLELRRHMNDVVGLTGHLVGDVVQSCVVSLAPVAAHIETDFEASYSAREDPLSQLDFDPLDRDGPEPLIDGQVDLGEAVAQQLAVALDPYPRAAGAVLQPVQPAASGEQSGKNRPFDALVTLKKRP